MHSSYSLAEVVCCTVFTVLGVVAVLLRQYAQRLKKQSMTTDGWFLLAGLVSYVHHFLHNDSLMNQIIIVAHGGLIIYGAINGGLGWPIQDLKGPKVYTIRKVVGPVHFPT
jgi:uncharacterized membrane protein